MPNSDFQRHSFLGGEVSPSLYERADMDKFGKWFSKAENIRFRETGAFRNRAGFVKVADTKYNQQGQIIKLLSFAFNDEESFLIELGPNYARFYRNGQQIMNGSEPYEIATSFSDFDENDLKYAQAGDTIFITHPSYGIYELARLQVDGSQWSWNKFNADILPMKEENEDKDITISAAISTLATSKCSIFNNDLYYKNTTFTFDSVAIIDNETVTREQLISIVQESLQNGYSVFAINDDLYIQAKNPAAESVPSFSISFLSEWISNENRSLSINTNATGSVTNTLSYSGLSYLDSVSVYIALLYDGVKVIANETRNVTSPSLQNSISASVGCGIGNDEQHSERVRSDNGLQDDSSNSRFTYTFFHSPRYGSAAHYVNGYISLTGRIFHSENYTYTSSAVEGTNFGYELTATNSVFASININDCVLVKNNEDSQELKGDYSAAGTYTLGPVKSDGNWRFYTLGNWVGDIVIQYSTDNQQTWVDYYKWASQDANDTPANINTSGSLVADDLVWFRVVSTVSSTGTKPLQVFFAASSFAVNSYYKVLYKSSNSSVIVECVKNDVGEFSNNYQWRLPAFSNAEGWPQTIAFYQNRLFFGKDYIVYGSRSNDFWDFYEPIKLQADDPLTMSLLSQKVNNIKNLVTQRSFFTFTGGGEFGIGSEGALTQSDKYLKPFSSNGSAQCAPVLISDVVLFVDKSYNTVRALKYSLEADGYEAPDITITLKALLDNEKIISTDIIYEEKEALFLSDTGTIWVLKYITDQNVLSWSHWEHAFGKITNICVVPNGPKHDLYIAVQANGYKWIEKMDQTEFMDTVETFAATQDEKVSVTGVPGDKKAVIQGDKRYFKVIDENGQIECPDDETAEFKVGSVYTSTATLLSPVAQASEYAHNNYELKSSFKVFFYYLNSYGFKVGIEEDKKEDIEWQPIDSDIDDETNLTSGKKSVLIESSFDSSARLTFVQQEPYPMEVCDVLVQTDVGGK